MDFFCLLCCNTCGQSEEVAIPIPVSIVINEEVITKICESELPNWGYFIEADEWMCDECMHKPLIYRITDDNLMDIDKAFKTNVNQETWAWEKLIKKGVAEQLGIDSDSVLASEVEVKAYMNPHSMSTDFYISPVGMSWLDIKKRHPAKGVKSRMP